MKSKFRTRDLFHFWAENSFVLTTIGRILILKKKKK